MSYTVVVESRAARQLRTLPRTVLQRIDTLIEAWRVRVGDYRILYTINDDEHVVRIYRIAHRREAYR